MSKLNISRLTNENEDGSPKISGITTFSSTAFLEAPKGTTAQRPTNPQPGMIRFNTDGGHLEYFTGEFWDEVLVANNTLDGGNRGLFGGGNNPSVNIIDYITISTIGNALDFGDLIGSGLSNLSKLSASSSTRALFAGGYTPGPGPINSIDFITISSTGNAADFGDLTRGTYNGSNGVCSSSTRGIFAGLNFGTSPLNSNVIDYVTIASIGNAQDFGDLSAAKGQLATCCSSTRGVFAAGYTAPSGPRYNVIEYITIQSTGNAVDFGDLSESPSGTTGCSNSTRGLFSGGFTSLNVIEFITIASTGNSTDFGDLTQGRTQPSSVSSPTRGVFGGGRSPTIVNTIDYVTILTTGNATDFGDLTLVREDFAACSNGHGGL